MTHAARAQGAEYTRKRLVKRGEPLALMREALHTSRDAIWWDQGPSAVPNERIGSVAVVYVRGSLEHHDDTGGDSYEGILARARCAFAGEDESGEACGEPSAVVLRIDSPGGVVSGLNETVYALQRMARESGIPLVAYVDELAASAAYALACACDEIAMPASAICGSVGVISTLFSQERADKKAGVDVVTLTSGARKADGHPHVQITDDAIAAEQRRVDRLARQFFKIVSKSRGMARAKVEALEAGIFLGAEAVANGLATAVLGWDDVVATLNDSRGVNTKQLANAAESGSSSTLPTGRQPEGNPMSLLAIAALIKNTTASLKAEKDPRKKKILATSLASYTATLEAMKKEKHVKETHEVEESSEEEEEAAEEEAAESKGNETDRKESDDDGDESDDDKDGDGDSDEEEDDEEEEEAEAAMPPGKSSKKMKMAGGDLQRLAEVTTGKKGRAAVGALASIIEQGRRATTMVDQIVKERRAEKKAALIDEALNAHAILKHEARDLRGKPMSFVSAFLDMRRNKKTGAFRAVINAHDESLAIPERDGTPGDGSTLSAEIKRSVEVALNALPDGVDRVKARAQMYVEHEKRNQAAVNGAAGRY